VSSTSALNNAVSLIRHARTGGYSDAASYLNLLLQDISTAIRSESLPPEIKTSIVYSLETMYLLQQQEDWIGLADVVEYELLDRILMLP